MTLLLSAKAFSISASSVWNSLLHNYHSAEQFNSFKCILKSNSLTLPTVTVNTPPRFGHHVPLILLWHLALLKCIVFNWWPDAIQPLQNTWPCPNMAQFVSYHRFFDDTDIKCAANSCLKDRWQLLLCSAIRDLEKHLTECSSMQETVEMTACTVNNSVRLGISWTSHINYRYLVLLICWC